MPAPRSFAAALSILATLAAAALPRDAAPTSVDWVSAGAVLPVANEGANEVSWAYSAVVVIAAAQAISRGTPRSPAQLSVKQLVDCAGGWQGVYAYTTVTGVCNASEYKSGPSGACGDAGCTRQALVLQWVNIPVGSKSEAAVAAALSQQPLVALVDQSSASFSSYAGGVLNASDCGTNLNHYLALTGFGVDATTGQTFWSAQNCWSTAWGEKGYVRLARGGRYDPAGECGVQMAVGYPVVH